MGHRPAPGPLAPDDTDVFPAVEPDRPPVFVDASGGRRRAVRGVAIITGCAVLGAAGLLSVVLLGAPNGPPALFTGRSLTGTTTRPDSPGTAPNRATNSSIGTATSVVAPARPSPTAKPSTRTTTAAPTTTVTPTKPHGRPTPPGHNR
ncbi:MAG TPA: hypothetical protein VH352_10120 [Pseudonocardiaceae bacterium]|nr:hypothetical protein [Pseudonocardiaceae bacterium]